MNLNDKDFQSISYMKKQVKDLRPGDTVLHPIYRSDGLMLIPKNKELSASIINTIRRQVSLSSFVLVATDKDIWNGTLEKNLVSTSQFQTDLDEITKNYNSRTSTPTSITTFIQDDTFPSNQSTKNHSTDNIFARLLSNYPLWLHLGDKLESEKLKERSEIVKSEILNFMLNDQTFKDLFQSLRDYDDVLFIHSINTTCISLMIGLTIELNTDELIDLAVAALFANTGFLDMPKKEFKKFLISYTSNPEPINKHLEIFSNMTFDSPYLRKKSIIYGILDHHEYFNGNGYPTGKKGEEISLYGRIIHISHAYDELVGGYKSTAGLSPIEALKQIYENEENKFDQDILNTFIHRTTYFKLGEPIILPNGLKGTIIGFENFLRCPHLPIIELKNGKKLNLQKYLNKET